MSDKKKNDFKSNRIENGSLTIKSYDSCDIGKLFVKYEMKKSTLKRVLKIAYKIISVIDHSHKR